jgi:hypothetical protein
MTHSAENDVPDLRDLTEGEVHQLFDVWREAGPMEASPVAVLDRVNLILSHRRARVTPPGSMQERWVPCPIHSSQNTNSQPCRECALAPRVIPAR